MILVEKIEIDTGIRNIRRRVVKVVIVIGVQVKVVVKVVAVNRDQGIIIKRIERNIIDLKIVRSEVNAITKIRSQKSIGRSPPAVRKRKLWKENNIMMILMDIPLRHFLIMNVRFSKRI